VAPTTDLLHSMLTFLHVESGYLLF